MRGTVAKRLRKLAKVMAEYKVNNEKITDPEYVEKAAARAYKLLKKNYIAGR